MWRKSGEYSILKWHTNDESRFETLVRDREWGNLIGL